jgi:hypothetical protein
LKFFRGCPRMRGITASLIFCSVTSVPSSIFGNTVASVFFRSVASLPNQMSRTPLPHCFFAVLHRFLGKCQKHRCLTVFPQCCIVA